MFLKYQLKKIFYLLPLLFLAAQSLAQYNASSVNKKAADIYSKALNKAGEGEYIEAIRMLGQAVKMEPKFLDAYLSIGGIYGEMKNYRKAAENYEKAIAIDSIYCRDYALPYSINLAFITVRVDLT